MELAWIVHSNPGLPDGYAVVTHGCQMASDVHVSKCAYLDINDMDNIYHISWTEIDFIFQIKVIKLQIFVPFYSLFITRLKKSKHVQLNLVKTVRNFAFYKNIFCFALNFQWK